MGAQAYKETGQARKVHHSLFATFFTLRILFFDLLISVGDVATDFYQAWNLYTTSDLQTYGIITFAINWLPGLVAAIHCISVKRDIFGAKKTIMWAGKNFKLPFKTQLQFELNFQVYFCSFTQSFLPCHSLSCFGSVQVEPIVRVPKPSSTN